MSEAILELVQEGKVRRIAYLAQNEERSKEIQVDGPSGFLAVSPPWFKARYEGKKVVWPNGAVALPFTPNEPGNIRGDGVQVTWATEMQSWPHTTRDEAWANLEIMCSTSPAIVMGDCTPKRRHPILKLLRTAAEEEPSRHHVVGGTIEENRDNLAPGVIADLRRRMDGTQRGREELDGIQSDDDANALWKQEWIDAARRNTPGKLKRRILSIDPAISRRKGTDQTGISDCGLGIDDQLYVLADLTGRYRPEDWADLVVDRYEAFACDCVVVERNRGGDLVASMLRAAGQSPERVAIGKQVRVEIVDEKAITRHVRGVVYVKEVVARISKEERAEPVASLYKQGRVSHVREANLDELEDLLCTWEPSPSDSPDRMDPMVHGIAELAGLRKVEQQDTHSGLGKVAQQLRPQGRGGIGSMLGGGTRRL